MYSLKSALSSTMRTIGLALLCVGVLCGCDERTKDWDVRPQDPTNPGSGLTPTVGLTGSVAVFDPSLDRVLMLTVPAGHDLQTTDIGLGRNPSVWQASPDRERLFVLSAGVDTPEESVEPTLTVIDGGTQPAVCHRFALDVPHEQAAGEDVSVPIAESLPPGLRWYGALFDRSQHWLMEHLVCGRHHSHVHFTAELLATHPTREFGLALPAEGLPVYVIDAVGVPGWTMPNVIIIDRHGLNDHVVARAPLAEGHVRQMAHDRSAPRDYVAEFRPNVRLLPVAPFVRVRERRKRPLSAQDIVEIEDRWWARADEWLQAGEGQ